MSNNDADTQESNVCPTCGDSFERRAALGSHHKFKHGQTLLEAERDSSDAIPCPSCDRDDFKNERGMKCHHKITHGESIAGDLAECHICGGEFRQSRANLEKAERSFCSSECRGEWLSPQWEGEDNPRCRESVTVECSNCGNKIDRPPWWAARDQEHFCNEACADEYFTGENSPRYNGGLEDYGPGWNDRTRRMVRNRDDRECVDCGMSQSEHLEKNGERLHVHHIRKASSFEDPERRNSMNNLVTLCRGCHLKWEGVPMDYQP